MEDLEKRILALFLEIAPDVDPAVLDRELPFREQFDFDSMDTLNFAVALHKAFGIGIPDTDLRRLCSLVSTVEYVRSALLKA